MSLLWRWVKEIVIPFDNLGNFLVAITGQPQSFNILIQKYFEFVFTDSAILLSHGTDKVYDTRIGHHQPDSFGPSRNGHE